RGRGGRFGGRRASKTNARWLLGRPTLFCKWLGVFLFVLKLDGAVGSKHHTGLLEVGLEEGWRRLLGARLIGIARQPFSALNVHIIGCAEDGHSRYLAISEGRYERRRTEQRRRLLLGLDLRHDQPSQCRRSPLKKPPSAIQCSTASSKRSASGPAIRSKVASGCSTCSEGISGGFQVYLDTHRSPLRGSRRPMTISVRGGA